MTSSCVTAAEISSDSNSPVPDISAFSRAVAAFTRNHRFAYVDAFHSQGEVIYWRYANRVPNGAKQLAEKMAEVSGYRLADTEGTASYSGYKDWFIKAFDRPAFTVEVGMGTNPLSEYQLPKIYNNTLELMLLHNLMHHFYLTHMELLK